MPELLPAQIAIYVVLAVALAISVKTDLESRLILDKVTFPTMGVALAIRLISTLVMGTHGVHGRWGIVPGLVGLAIGFGLFLMFARAGGMGDGDVKLMGAVGAAVGFPSIAFSLFFTAMVGGLQAVLHMIWRGSTLDTLKRTGRLALHLLHFKRMTEEQQVQIEESGDHVPYGVAIALGTVWGIFYEFTHPLGFAPGYDPAVQVDTNP